MLKTSQQSFGDYDLVTETQYDHKARVYSTTLPYQSNQSVIYKTINQFDVLDCISQVTYPDNSIDKRYYGGYNSSERVMVTRIEYDFVNYRPLKFIPT